MICKNCDFNNQNGEKFCKQCGANLNDSSKDESNINQSKVSRYIPILAGLVAIIGIGVVAVSVLNSSDGLFKTNKEAAKFESVYKSQQQENTHYYDKYKEAGEQILMSSVDNSNKQDYTNYTMPHDFETFSADGYSFGYPKNYFNIAEKIQNGYQLTADDGAILKVIVEPRNNSSISMTEEMDKLYKNYLNEFYNVTTIVYRDDEDLDYRRFVISGYDSSNKSASNYVLCNVYNDKIEFYHSINPVKGCNKEEISHLNYILDTIYRYCSFSGTSYAPRTYNQFKNDDLGSKK